MKKSLLLLVPFMFLVGCSISGLNPFGTSEVNGSTGGLANFAIQVFDPSKGTITVDEVNITNANFRLIPPVGTTQTTNWAPGLSGYILFNPIVPGVANLRLIDFDAVGINSTNSTNITIRSGYNYRILVTLGGMIYLSESSVTNNTVSNWLAMYSTTHVAPALNNVFGQGANLFIWTPGAVLTEVGGGTAYEGASNWNFTRAVSTTNFIGFGITSTNGLKDRTIYAGGHMKLAVRAFNSGNTYKVGMISVTGVVTNDRAVDLVTVPGYAADGLWHGLSIPMYDFPGIDFAGISTYFYIASTAIVTNTNTFIAIDDVYWSRD